MCGNVLLAAVPFLWAHYTPWHTPENDSLTTLWYVNHAVSEPKDGDPHRGEIRRAMAQGIDGFLFDVCVKDGATTFSDLSAFLAASEGTPFLCAVCLDRKTTVENQISELKKTLAKNAAHPNYARVGGVPLVATYTWHDWTPDEWRRIKEGMDAAGTPVYLVANLGLGQKPYDTALLAEYAKSFDMGYYFGYGARGPSKAEKNANAAAICAKEGKPFMPAVSPGYFGGWVHGRNDFYTPFRALDSVQNAYEAAKAAPGAKWLHLTTWNDYDETALVPCRLTPGNFSLVRAYSDDWKGREPAAERADVVISYHREEFAGTVVRFEAMRLPSRDGGEVRIAGRLRNKDGNAVATLGAKTLGGAAWERVEWLVASADLAASPVLVPEFALRDAAGTRRAETPPVFLVRGWLECPETIRVAFADCAAVAGKLDVDYADGRITARMSFDAETPVKRAILYRNDRPLGQFAPGEPDGAAQISLNVGGKGNWKVAAEGGEVAEAVRSSCAKSANGKLRLDAEGAHSDRTPGWARCAVRAVGGADMRLALAANGKRRELAPAELAEARRISVGGVSFSMAPDMTLYERKPWNAVRGEAALALFDRPPRSTDAFWVRFETADGRAAATRPIWPFAPEVTVEEAALVETPVTLESPSGPNRERDAAEFRTPRAEWPVKETRIVRRPASKLSVRRAVWPLGGRDGADALARGENAAGTRRIEGDRLPLRMWPTGPATIAFDVMPDEEDLGRRCVLFRRTGWMDGVSQIALTEGGAVEASYGEHKTLATATGKTSLAAGAWTRVAVSFDGVKLGIWINGKRDGEASLAAPVRCYGNCTAYVGGGKSAPFKGKIANVGLVGKELK